jgi:hypothetical protein
MPATASNNLGLPGGGDKVNMPLRLQINVDRYRRRGYRPFDLLTHFRARRGLRKVRQKLLSRTVVAVWETVLRGTQCRAVSRVGPTVPVVCVAAAGAGSLWPE